MTSINVSQSSLSGYTAQPLGVAAHTSQSSNHPETFRLPVVGKRDPYFGLSRAFYYQLEALGAIRLVRLRKRGTQRGVTLVPFETIKKYIQSQQGGTGHE